MTDRELLELAAKAAGYGELKWIAFSEHPQIVKTGCRLSWWNPLKDDGDALRLAVKLAHDGIYVIDIGVIISSSKRNGANPYAATRRAIVRAAAEIGKTVDD